MQRVHPMDAWHRLDEAGAVLLVLTSQTCGTCRAVKAALLALPSLPFALDIIEVDAAEGRGLVEEHETFHLPGLYVYVDGELVGEVQAPPRPAALADAIRQVVASSAGV